MAPLKIAVKQRGAFVHILVDLAGAHCLLEKAEAEERVVGDVDKLFFEVDPLQDQVGIVLDLALKNVVCYQQWSSDHTNHQYGGFGPKLRRL